MIVISQDGWTSAGGTSGTGNQEQPLKEEETKAGENPPQTEGKIQDTNVAEDGGEKQDIGGLAGLPSDSESSLKGKNLDFKKEPNTEEGAKKVELTENNDLGGESKVELNKNEFSTKDSDTESEKFKFVIEKKDDEEFAETGEGTKYTVGEGENGEKNAKDELAGREIELTPGSEIEQTKEGNVESANIKSPEGGEIHTPGDRKNGEEKEGEETKYNWFGNNLNWLDSKGNSHTVNGKLSWDSKNGFYVPKNEQSSIDGVNLFSENSNTRVFSDGRTPSKIEAPGPYASFGQNNFVTGSNNENAGPIASFLEGNKYGVNIDSSSDIFRMQADSNGQISLTNRNPQQLPKGEYPLVEITGMGGVVNNGNKNYASNGQRYDLIRDPNIKDRTSVPIQIIPRNSENGNSLLAGDKSWHINNFNQKAEIPNNYNFDRQGPFTTNEGSFDPRLSYNILNQEQQNWVNDLETLQKKQNFLSLNQQERAILESQNLPGKSILETQREILSSNNPHEGVRNLQLQNQQPSPLQPSKQNQNIPPAPNTQPRERTQNQISNPSTTQPRAQAPMQTRPQENKLSNIQDRKLITYNLQPVRKTNNGQGLSVLDDIESQANNNYNNPAIAIYPDGRKESLPYEKQDIMTKAHETTHSVNERIRQQFNGGKGVNGFYLLDGKYKAFREPKITMGDIHQGNYIPQSLQGNRYNTYVITNSKPASQQVIGNTIYDNHYNTPLNLMDELTAYTNGASAGIQAIQNGKWDGGNRDGVAGVLDLNVYNIGLGMAIKDKDPNYFNDPQVKEFFKYSLERSMNVFNQGKSIPQFQNADQETVLFNLQKGPNAEPMRQFLRQNYGSDWTRKVYGF